MQPQPPRKKATTHWRSRSMRRKSIRPTLPRTLRLAETRPSLARRPRPLGRTSEKRGATTNRKRRAKLPRRLREIGRASCRGRVEISGGAVSLKKKKEKVFCVGNVEKYNEEQYFIRMINSRLRNTAIHDLRQIYIIAFNYIVIDLKK